MYIEVSMIISSRFIPQLRKLSTIWSHTGPRRSVWLQLGFNSNQSPFFLFGCLTLPFFEVIIAFRFLFCFEKSRVQKRETYAYLFFWRLTSVTTSQVAANWSVLGWPGEKWGFGLKFHPFPFSKQQHWPKEFPVCFWLPCIVFNLGSEGGNSAIFTRADG